MLAEYFNARILVLLRTLYVMLHFATDLAPRWLLADD